MSKIPPKWKKGDLAWWVDPYNGDDPSTEDPPRFEPRIGCNEAEIIDVTADKVVLKRVADGEEWAFPIDGTPDPAYGDKSKNPKPRAVDLPSACERYEFFPEDGYKNMTELKRLNQAELDRNLQLFHAADKPYCYCGNTLVALNLRTQKNGIPTVDTSHLYTDECMDAYENKTVNSTDCDPHIYAVADTCLKQCFEPADGAFSTGGPQAMVITGESGAGKSYNTKVALKYLAYKGLGADPTTPKSTPGQAAPEIPVTTRMVRCNDILEAFGNASMPRNPDSSRFGKLFQIFFDKYDHSITGCDITTYLLEKSRITLQGASERNYHIFYMLLAGQDILENEVVTKSHTYPPPFPNAAATMKLLNRENFRHLNQKYDLEPGSRKAGVYPEMYTCAIRKNDADERAAFTDLLQTFYEANFSSGDLEEIFRTMAFCLHLGNVDFVNNPKDDNAMVDPKTAEHLKNAAEMLRKSPEELETALVRNTIHVINKDGTVGRTYPQTFNAEQAVIQRHTLARNIYNDLFMQHIKEKIQKSLIGTARFDNNDPSSNAKICILDIFGFEFTPDKKLLSDNPKEGMPIMRNSLEQFCINWCNEALQDKFIRCVVDAEELFYDDQLGAPLGLDTSELDNKQTLKMIQGNDGWAIAKKLRDGGNMFKKDNRQTAEMKLIKKLQEEQGDPSNHDRVGRPILTFPDALNTSWKGKLRISTYLRDRKKKNPEAYPDIDDGHIFALKHYAGVVTYSMLDWLAKDANSVSDNMKEFLANSQAHPDRDNAWTPEYYQSRLYEKEASLITAAFKANMKDLIEGQLDKCYCWFTRCIKPCNKQRSEMMPPFDIAKKYEGYKVLDQLRYTGMLDALTIRKIGFSARLPHQEFALKYKLLCADLKPAPGPDDHQMIVDWILKQPWYKEVESPYAQADPSHPDIMVGNSKAGRESFVLMRDTLAQHLDSERENKLFKSGILIRYEWKAMHYGQEWKAKYKACVGGGKYKDEANCGPHPVNDVAYKPEHPLGLNSALRGILQRLQYYKDKHRYLQLKSRSNLAPLVRAQIKRNEYLKKRNARFEETNREMVQNWLRGTACRQGYYEAKLQFLEKEQMEAERAKMSQQEEFGREFMLDLEEERKMEEEERFNMEAEELYRNAILDALFLGTLNSNKERIFMGASEALCRAQAAYRRLKDAESAEGDLEQQVEANAEEIERGAHLKVQELLLSHIPKTLEQFGTCNQVRAPDTDNYQLTADELEAFPMDKVSDLGAVRRHVFATNPAYRDMNPAGPPKKKNEEELDEGFTFEKPKEPEPPEPVAATGQEPEASTDATTDATKALPEETKAPEPVQTNFSSGIELQLSVDPSSLNDAQKRKLIVEMSKIVGCDPSQLHVR